jgi:DNA-binding CsgD family transcriptional regulator/PAS domain-containing protein
VTAIRRRDSVRRVARGRPNSVAETQLALLSSLYETVAEPDGWATFMDALARSYRGGRATLFIREADTENGQIEASGRWEPEQITRFNQYYVANNPWSGRRLPGDPIGLVVRSEQLLPRSDLLTTEHYNDFLRPAQVESLIGVTIQRDGSRRIVLNVLFPQATAEHDSDLVGRLQRLVPHVLRVAQLNRQLHGFETRAVSAEAALSGLGTAMMAVNAASHVVYVNAAAERIIAAGDGPKVVRFVLDAFVPREGKLLRQLVASALQVARNVAASPGGVMRISRRSGCAPYEVLVAPVSGTTLGLGFDGPFAAVFVRDPEARIVPPTDRLQHLYALTGAEARLMQALLAGDTLDTIAERIGVSRETLRSQLKAVFLKTGTSSQIELIRLGLRGLAAFKE